MQNSRHAVSLLRLCCSSSSSFWVGTVSWSLNHYLIAVLCVAGSWEFLAGEGWQLAICCVLSNCSRSLSSVCWLGMQPILLRGIV